MKFLAKRPETEQGIATQASFWLSLTSLAEPGGVVLLKTAGEAISDSIAMARWLQSTAVNAINAQLPDPAIRGCRRAVQLIG